MLQAARSRLARLLSPFRRKASNEELVARAMKDRFDRSEVLLVCFPKCGSTWLEVLLTQYFVRRYGTAAEGIRDLHRVSLQVPSVAVTWRTHDGDPHLKPAAQFETDKSAYAPKRVLFLVRDPRDIVVSYFFDYTKKMDHVAAGRPAFTGAVDDFVHHEIGGLRAVIAFLNIWAGNTTVPREFLLMTYEDLRRDPIGQAKRALAYLDTNPVDEGMLAEAVAFASFDNMRKLEEQNVAGLRLNPNVALGDTDGYKVRRGKVGGYHDYFSPDTVAEADRIVRDELSDFYAFYKR